MGKALDGGFNIRHWVNETRNKVGNTGLEGRNPMEEREHIVSAK